ncbi:MAG TPA: Rieske 2Fe-2S domain-containing protein [Xanthobacteraceae bacterium]|nr:Rieske 2Fe-2S domain-containing protein [Xanthobacteraceae bacterium]
MLTVEENDLLCRVEGDAPMGQLMRQHWIPVCLSEEVPEPDGTPIRVRLLGEDLVVFRDTNGRVGVLDEYCPHRRASLVYGRNEECGLRCLYHGWKVDVEGNVVEMPSEPSQSGLTEKVKHKAYPTHECAGFVWAYMGAVETMPEFERPAFAPSEQTRVSIVKIHVPCNWAQVLEGQIDSAHSSVLHASDMRPAKVTRAGALETHWVRPSTDKSPRMETERTSYGFHYAAIRRPIMNAQTHDYVRKTVYIAPFTALIPPNDTYNIAALLSPTDDTHTVFHFIAWSEGRGIDQESWRKFNMARPGIDLDVHFNNLRNRENNYLQNRDLMKLGSATGIAGIPNQDIAMWATMGPIADRTRERLGASDIAIVEFRRLMVDAARTMKAGGPALGRTEPHIAHTSIASFEGIVPKGTDWRPLQGTVAPPKERVA